MTRTTKEHEPIAPVAGAADYEQPDFLPAGTGVDWLEELRDQHLAVVRGFSIAVTAIGNLEAEQDEGQRVWRRAVRDAVVAGEATPERPDTEVQKAKRELAEEELAACRDELARVVVASLAELRRRRPELEPHLGACSPALLYALRSGPYGVIEDAKAELRRSLEALESDGPAILDLDDPANDPLTREEATHA